MTTPTKEQRDAWRSANKGRIADYQRSYNALNKGKRAAWNSSWKRKNKWNGNFHWARRRATLRRATPIWAEREKMAVVYRKAEQYGMDVDHIVPLFGDTVCGLHCWHNLQLLSKSENSQKSNKAWPDMPSSGGLAL